MARITSNRLVEDLDTVKRVTKVNAPAIESENARLEQVGPGRHANCAIDLSAVACTFGGVDTDAPTSVPAMRAGFVDSIAYAFSANISAGGASAASIQLTVNGTAVGDIVLVASGGSAAQSGVVDESTPVAFNEGDLLGIALSTSHTFAPTTDDFSAYLAVRWTA